MKTNFLGFKFRLPLIVCVRLHRSLAFMCTTAVSHHTTSLLESLPPDSCVKFTSYFLKDGIAFGVASLGYQLPSFFQVIKGAWTVAPPLRNAFIRCNIPNNTLVQTQNTGVHIKVSGWLNWAMQQIFPITVSRKSAGPLEAPCHVAYLWGVFTVGFLIPLMIANMLEEASRREFLKWKGYYVNALGVAWRLVQAVGVILFGARISWEILSIVATWTTLFST